MNGPDREHGSSIDNDLPEGKEAPPPGTRAMAIVRWALVGAMALAAVISVASVAGFSLERTSSNAGPVIYYCAMHPQIQQDHPGQCPICGMTLVKAGPKKLPPAAPATPAASAAPTATAAGNPAHKYQCPMHPEVTSDDPNARCPKCGMKLEPRPTGTPAAPANVVAGASDAGVPGLVPINIPSDRVQLIGVRTQKVTRGQLGDRLQTVGVVEPDERGLAQISTRFPGWIETLAIAETGAQVRRGQVLATIFSPLVLEAQEELLSALRWSSNDKSAAPAGPHSLHGGAASLVEDARHRLELLGIAPEEIDEIVRARKPQRAIAIRSPVDGHVVARRVTLGMAVQPGTPLYQVADLRTLWVLADIFESDAARVRIGQAAAFRVSTYPGEQWKGKVEFIYPLLDSDSRTLRVRIALAPQRGKSAAALKLRPGMYGDVELALPPSPAITIPSEAVVDTGDLQYVFVDLGNGHFQPRPVRLGRRVGERVEIQLGLAEGELVVTTANFLLDSESRLRAAIDRTPGAR